MADKKAERAALAAKMVAEQKAKQRRSTLLKVAGVIAGMAVIIAVCVVVGIKAGGDDGNTTAQGTVPPAGGTQYGVTYGDPNAPHKVVMYEDFLCPYCQQFEEEGHDQLQKLADDGKVFLDYRPFNLLAPDYSVQAANAFWVVEKEAGKDVALKYHNLLYTCPGGDHTSPQCNQPDEQTPTVVGNGTDAMTSLVNLAVQAGADEGDVKTKIENGEYDSIVTKSTQEAYNDGINSTPTIYLDGKIFQSGATMAELADNLIKAVQ